VISSSYSEGFRKEFHKEFHKYCLEKNIVAEFTRFHPVLKNERFSWGYLNINYSRKTVVLDLTRSKEEIWNSSYSSTNRNMIRKAKKNKIGFLIPFWNIQSAKFKLQKCALVKSF